jgi:hydroxymethylbilane synthase
VELVILKTTGDQVVDRPLHEIGGKGLFTKELELALLDGRIDFAVHSYKDVPVTMPLVDQTELTIAAVPKRENAGDVMVSRVAKSLAELPAGAKVGTGSLRRRSQILDRRPDLVVEMVRGNIDTRMKKIDAGFDAVILAAAGLSRSWLFDAATCHALPEVLPAPGQGALALQCRLRDEATIAVLRSLHHEPTARCVSAERAIVAKLDGDCHSPIAALATIDGSMATLAAAVGCRDGNPPIIRASRSEQLHRLPTLADAVYADLAALGAREMLRPALSPE